MRTALAACLALASLVTGCGSDNDPVSEANTHVQGTPAITPTESTVGLIDPDLRVTCDGPPGWPVSAMDGGIVSKIPKSELVSALQTFLDSYEDPLPIDETEIDSDDARWFVLRETRKTVTVALGNWSIDGPDEDAWTLDFTKANGQWVGGIGGGCNLRPVIPDRFSWVELESASPSASDPKRLRLMVVPLDCSTPADPRPVLRTPVVEETDVSVTISLTVTNPPTEPGVSYTCEGYPSVPYTVKLSHPLNDRKVFDGSVYPASEVGTEPEPESDAVSSP